MRKDAILNDSRVSCIKCKGNGVKPSIKAPINIYKYYYLHGAKSRNLEWSLSDEQFENLIFTYLLTIMRPKYAYALAVASMKPLIPDPLSTTGVLGSIFDNIL